MLKSRYTPASPPTRRHGYGFGSVSRRARCAVGRRPVPRSEARLQFGIWEGLKGLSDAGKLLYPVLLTEEYLTQCGRGPVLRDIWAARLEWDRSKLDAALAELDEKRYALIDDETNELLIRSFIRGDKVDRQPRVLQAALKAAVQVKSPRLREALAAELRRLDDGTRTGLLADVVQEALAVADQLDGRRPAPVAPKPLPVEEQTLAVEDVRPPDQCEAHLGSANKKPCRACASARNRAKEWEAQRLRAADEANAADARRRAAERRVAIDACNRCDSNGYEGRRLCDHTERRAT